MLHVNGSSPCKGTTHTSHLKYELFNYHACHILAQFSERVTVLVGSRSSLTFKLFMQNNFGDLSIVAEGHVMTFNSCLFISLLIVPRSAHNFSFPCKRSYVL